jgi:hypothetical protein
VTLKRYLFTNLLAVCLIYLVACASSSDTAIKDGTKNVPSSSEIQFDFAAGASLPVERYQQKQTVAIKNFRVGDGRNRLLIAGVHVEEMGGENVNDMVIASVTCGDRKLTLLPDSEIELSEMWRGDEYFLKVALYYLINPPSGTHDIKVTYAGPVRSGNVGAISLHNAQQAAPVTLVTNKQKKQKKIITKITTKNDGAWVVDIVGCGHKSKLRPKTEGHIRQFNTQEKTGGKSSMVGGTLAVPNAGEVTLHWAQPLRTINRIGHMVVEIAPYR